MGAHSMYGSWPKRHRSVSAHWGSWPTGSTLLRIACTIELEAERARFNCSNCLQSSECLATWSAVHGVEASYGGTTAVTSSNVRTISTWNRQIGTMKSAMIVRFLFNAEFNS